jgi:hypothetical protein
LTRDEVIDWLQERIQGAEQRNKRDDDLAASFVSKTSRGLPIRPSVLGLGNEPGTKVYGVTLAQARRWLAQLQDEPPRGDGWALYSWSCSECGSGRSEADHDRREWPPVPCPKGHGPMDLSSVPLVPQETVELPPESEVEGNDNRCECGGRYRQHTQRCWESGDAEKYNAAIEAQL